MVKLPFNFQTNLNDERLEMSENVFSSYDFGGHIIASQMWNEARDEWQKRITIQMPNCSREILFSIGFEPGSASVLYARALDSRTHEEVGYRKPNSYKR